MVRRGQRALQNAQAAGELFGNPPFLWCSEVCRAKMSALPLKGGGSPARVRGFPNEPAAVIALNTAKEWLSKNYNEPEILINSAGLSNQPNAEEVQPLFWEGSVTVVTLPDPLFFKLACAPHPMETKAFHEPISKCPGFDEDKIYERVGFKSMWRQYESEEGFSPLKYDHNIDATSQLLSVKLGQFVVHEDLALCVI
ncbi:hypothetical protein Q9966_012220 [Columba livia]|nr:hypothetical protein Q9966_012220 [Columba livia]